MCHVVDDVFQDLHFIGLAHQGIELGAYFALSRRCDFVVMHLCRYAQLLDREAHRPPNIM